ncbi:MULTISPECIES: phenylacetate--CoA ligase family protein [Clostridium]|uniref:Phenylacetate--CoA ligase family protein n=1 Tax=Clostridium botulinum TaxID=1491 RepID=A0A846I265_CLOBO|nr:MULTISPECIES: phenylacetate--CoA ligase family protein [Clostridium]KGO15604.1 phenylacetate--CoA ligase [Clostridium botulinum]KOY66158.1 phenylacetate--CoA ligase [Clostridium sporogenes]MDS1006400.1 phenylacetate--CoA ligase family protein [Clostridium sporogenes]NEZ93588.1 phenylacetate--CoA ligase family protein [Clostridium botulinum]QRI52004.1 phenylacetate--CoA ligase family protein [Clostridium botulinum]
MEDINEKLIKVVQHAGKHSSYYKRIFNEANINVDEFKGIEDLSKLPIVTSEDLIKYGKEFACDDAEIYRVSSSSGTSHNPKSLFRTHNDTEMSSIVLERLLKMAGLKKGDSIYIGQPFDMAHLGYLTMNACERLGIMAIPAGLSQINEKMIDLISYYNPTAIFTSVSRMKAIISIIKSSDSINVNPKHILLAGEPMLPADRKLIKDFWGVEPIDLYGSEETDGLGGGCINGGMHFMSDLYYLELLPVENAKCVNNNHKFGEAVITCLYGEGTPLIRYRLGDLIELIPTKCSCGCELPLIKVHGRIGDSIVLFDGIKLYAYQVEDVLKGELINLSNYQIVCSTLVPGLEEVVVKVKTADEVENLEEVEKSIVKKLWDSSLDLAASKEIGSLRFKVEINKEDLYMTKRGKTPRIIDFRISKGR